MLLLNRLTAMKSVCIAMFSPHRFPRCPLIPAFLFLVLSCSLASGQRVPFAARNAIVVAPESLATATGVAILQNGGNAIDAAVGVGFALAVTYPEAGNIGGGGFMVVRLGDGQSTVIDFREKAPGLAHRDMYLSDSGEVIPGKSTHGSLAAGVPGTVSGFLMALERYGSLDRAEVMEPAIRLAEEGFRIPPRLAASLMKQDSAFSDFPATVRQFSNNGAPFLPGDILRQPDLAGTLRTIRDKGTAGFYSGRVAQLIAAVMQEHGGIISLRDLAEYEAVEREPLVGSYRGYDIVTVPPPSAGGVVLLQMLNILELFEVSAYKAASTTTLHLIAAAAQRAYADRAEYLGDPDHVTVPVEGLVSKQYASERAGTIDITRASPSEQIHAGIPVKPEEQHTTHYSVVDRWGNAVSVTVTLNDLYGCKTVVDGAGFFLNDEMDDFVSKPGSPNMYGLVGGEANAIAPGKRMLSSMTPTIVLKDDRPFMLLGSRGGSRITTSVVQVIMNVVDFGMNIQDAVDTPRIHHQWLPDKVLYEVGGLTPGVEGLRGLGYIIEETTDPNGRLNAVLIDRAGGMLYGGPDRREGGTAGGF